MPIQLLQKDADSAEIILDAEYHQVSVFIIHLLHQVNIDTRKAEEFIETAFPSSSTIQLGIYNRDVLFMAPSETINR